VIAALAIPAGAVYYKLHRDQLKAETALSSAEQKTLRDSPFDPAALLDDARKGAKDSPDAKPGSASSNGPDSSAGYREEPDSFSVDAPKGRFQVVIEPGGRSARRAVLE